MCSSSLDFRLAALTVVGEESVSAALLQHGECDSDYLNITVYVLSPFNALPLLLPLHRISTTMLLIILCFPPVLIAIVDPC